VKEYRSKSQRKIVILGGGFAGIQASLALARNGLANTLIDCRPYTAMLPVLPDYAGGWFPEETVCHPLSEILPDKCEFIQATVTAADLEKCSISTTVGDFSYDFLLIATGSVANLQGLQDSEDPVFQLDSLESARQIREALNESYSGKKSWTMVFAGAGYTGVELAVAIAAQARRRGLESRRIIMAEKGSEILPFLTDRQRNHVRKRLADGGIELQTGTEVKNAADKKAFLSNGDTIKYDFLFSTSGSKAALNNINGNLERIADGRLKVNSNLQVGKYENVFAAGDAAAISDNAGRILRKAVNFSFYSGRRAGQNIARLSSGEKLCPFQPRDLGWVIPLHDTGAGNFFSRIRLQGRFPLRMHYFMCGFRHYSRPKRFFFYKTSVKLLD